LLISKYAHAADKDADDEHNENEEDDRVLNQRGAFARVFRFKVSHTCSEPFQIVVLPQTVG
jgi:hypothetical protein